VYYYKATEFLWRLIASFIVENAQLHIKWVLCSKLHNKTYLDNASLFSQVAFFSSHLQIIEIMFNTHKSAAMTFHLLISSHNLFPKATQTILTTLSNYTHHLWFIFISAVPGDIIVPRANTKTSGQLTDQSSGTGFQPQFATTNRLWSVENWRHSTSTTTCGPGRRLLLFTAGHIACNAKHCNSYSNSVCPYVHPSVTRWYCTQTNEDEITWSLL